MVDIGRLLLPYCYPFVTHRLYPTLRQPDHSSTFPFSSFTKIQGRSSEIIDLPNGKKFHPVNIFGGALFRKFPQISKHKVIWDGKSLKFIFEAHRFPDDLQLRAQLAELLLPYSVPFSVVYAKKMRPSASGKHQYLEISGTTTGD